METISGITYSWSKNVTLKQIVVQYIKIYKLRFIDYEIWCNLYNYIKIFTNFEFESFDLYTSTSISISMLVEDSTRREGYKCTCRRNAKEFKCKHSLGVAILRGMLVPPPEAKCQQFKKFQCSLAISSATAFWFRPNKRSRSCCGYRREDMAMLVALQLFFLSSVAEQTADTSLQVEGPACPAI